MSLLCVCPPGGGHFSFFIFQFAIFNIVRLSSGRYHPVDPVHSVIPPAKSSGRVGASAVSACSGLSIFVSRLAWDRVTVTAGQTVTDLLMLNLDLRGAIRGFKFLDLNADGVRNDGEPGLAGVRVFLDLNHNGLWKSNEPSAITVDDDPATTDVDETGMWRIEDVVPGTYTVREVSPVGYDVGWPGPGGHLVVLDPSAIIGPLMFANIPLLPAIWGWKFDDLNGNGKRDRNRIRGHLPHLVLVVDVSDSTRNPYTGAAPGDVNGDGEVDTILDGELAAVIAVNQALIDQGLAATTDVSLVVFGENGFQIDMDPVAPGVQLTTSPLADADGNGVYDVEQVLRSIDRDDYGAALRTDYRAALWTVQQTIEEVGVPAGNANMLFVSDGEPNNPSNYAGTVALLRDMDVNLSAFGAGAEATLYTLRIIDPDTTTFTSPAELVALLDIQGSPSGGSWTYPGSSDGLWAEPGLGGVTVYLDQNDNHVLDWTDLDGDGVWDVGEGERWTVTAYDDPATINLDETGRYGFEDLDPGVYIVREIVPAGWVPSPLPIVLDDGFMTSYLPFTRSLADEVSGADVFNQPSADRRPVRHRRDGLHVRRHGLHDVRSRGPAHWRRTPHAQPLGPLGRRPEGRQRRPHHQLGANGHPAGFRPDDLQFRPVVRLRPRCRHRHRRQGRYRMAPPGRHVRRRSNARVR